MFDNILDKFKKKSTTEETHTANNQSTKKNYDWYNEHHDGIVVQRNFLLVLLVILLCLSIAAVLSISYIMDKKSFEPFVIQIDDVTGEAKIINPISSDVLSGNDALAQYFIKKYVTARETYNPVDFANLAKRTIRLFSTNPIYSNYLGYIKNEATNPTLRYGEKNTTFLVVKSWSKLSDTKYMLRFSINETSGAKATFNKISVVEFQYLPMELKDSDRDINPVGFQVTGYRVDDDNS